MTIFEDSRRRSLEIQGSIESITAVANDSVSLFWIDFDDAHGDKKLKKPVWM